MAKRFIFASESVTEGHPDKVCDGISDAILDACLAQDPGSRVACEAFAKGNLVVVGGEISTRADVDLVRMVRETVRKIGYTYSDCLFHADRLYVLNAVSRQSPDIARGVDPSAEDGSQKDQGAGDQGLMFGFACRETQELMPAPITFAHRLGRRLAEVRKTGKVGWLRPDGKTQVSVEYEGRKPLRVDAVVVSAQHAPEVSQKEVEEFILEEVVRKSLPPEFLDKKTRYFVNPTGRFVLGGPEADAGLTGRKVIVDSYGGMARHGGGAFSGKDPSKVDRSGAYMGRYVAKNIVAAGLAERVEVQFAYVIGKAEPVSIAVDTFGTGVVPDEKLEQAVREVFDLRPAAIISQLRLLRPIYHKTTFYGHFGRTEDLESITWERTDQVENLIRALG
ncbi:methionine adenosyltransferase [Candidatus Methylacidithermus pantelleriae]|uniref:S-adenosylmethionine synthase n=1 Tax=Candidatus Methylacidithermus pantelleriae TaxID=2744239 RepID=A0A8J2BKD4_9BACT|nr:methionine adenosyltransferase [Candidatus Methylacidithermus pantelleriae]CAF0702397.1 methionine adenosyltransferase [Candidatus Methylacidithermus pantelleriae]